MYFYHNSRDLTYRTPFGAAPVGVMVTMRADGVLPWGSKVYLRLWQGAEMRLMMLPGPDGRYTCSVKMPDKPCLLWYYFELETPEGHFYYGKEGNVSGGSGTITGNPPESWQITVYQPRELPKWYGESVAYQIFPDRFHRGSDWQQRQRDAAHPAGWKGTKRVVMQDWEDTPFYCRDEKLRVTRWPFFGGTLEGIREKLSYLKSMGIGVLYLNPIFLASSNHKYDTADYLTIDPGFGDEESFARLCREAKKQGIRILLDGVFSHTGDDSVYFNRYGNYPAPGAYSREGSPYDSWYRFGSEHPAGYECWWGVDSLPNVEETDPGYQELICGKDGVIRKWLRLGASGWRLDVADELPDSFIAKVRQAEKAEKDDALLMGEVWEDASNKISYGEIRAYLQGDELDCTMHYPFRNAALEYLLGIQTAGQFAERMETIKENYPRSAFYGALNLVGTHDTPRILTVLGEAPEGLSEAERESYRLPPDKRRRGVQQLKLLQVLQFTSPGVPCVYYGDEAGMEGFADPFNRGTFPWGKEDPELQQWVRMLSYMRQEYPVLIHGDARYEALDGDILKITRRLEQTEVLIYLSRAWDARSVPTEGKTWLDLLSGKVYAAGDESIPLPPTSALVLYREGGEDNQFSPLPALARTPSGKGVLCPIFSLPGAHETGTLKDAMDFLDTVKAMGCENWMLLPLCPAGAGNSPYSSYCVFAGDPRYIDPDWQVEDTGFEAFCRENHWWLPDYALYTVLHRRHPTQWQKWPKALRDRETLPREEYAGEIREIMEEQYRFHVQWERVHQRAKELGISLIGDIPIYAAVDSAETWAQREQFQLDGEGYPILRAGCPPDYFAPEGQDWGNPLYDWKTMEADGFTWWKRRLGQAFRQYDFVRLDHFRSFAAYYAIPAAKPAREGVWMKGIGIKFFRAMAEEFGTLPLVAEDLGTLDDQVYTLLAHTGLSGMNVWQFSRDELPNLPLEQRNKRLLFSGTHDNQTLAGFLKDEGDPRSAGEVLREILEMPAAAVILPVQDVLGLGDEARINVPGVPEGNWTWRMTKEQLAELGRISL